MGHNGQFWWGKMGTYRWSKKSFFFLIVTWLEFWKGAAVLEHTLYSKYYSAILNSKNLTYPTIYACLQYLFTLIYFWKNFALIWILKKFFVQWNCKMYSSVKTANFLTENKLLRYFLRFLWLKRLARAYFFNTILKKKNLVQQAPRIRTGCVKLYLYLKSLSIGT